MKHSLATLTAGCAITFAGCSNAADDAAKGGAASATPVERVARLAPANHPQMCYLFFSPDVLENGKIYRLLDTIADKTLYDFVFLTPRPGEGANAHKGKVEFNDSAKYRPALEKVVEYAHKRGLKVGLQIWPRHSGVPDEACERIIVEGETTLDASGAGSWTGKAGQIRTAEMLYKSDFLRAYAFKKTGDGFYEKGSVVDITDRCTVSVKGKGEVAVSVAAGPELAGRSVYWMSQHLYTYGNHHEPLDKKQMVEAFTDYQGIPFDGTALDEYDNLLVSNREPLITVRHYGEAMGKKYKAATGTPLVRGLFDMRYAPEGDDTVRVRAINHYMDILRDGPGVVEKAVYQASKETFGPKTFAGIHNTFHNGAFEREEPWATGDKWWSLPREYGQTDEDTSRPSELGITKAASMNAGYNQYYGKNPRHIATVALGHLRHGIRTHFHALNDLHGWGVSLEKPEVYGLMNPVEHCARLLNRFDPALPKTDTLVIFGMEALMNWYPDKARRNGYQLRSGMNFESKAEALMRAGYMTAAVTTDLINEGKLRLGADGKPEMNGHRFERVVFLQPEYARESTLRFLEEYLAAGGKLMLEGAATRDFDGKDIRARFEAIRAKASVTGFDSSKMPLLGAQKDVIPDGALNEDGSYVFTDYDSLDEKKPAATRTIATGGADYAFDYRGLAAIAADASGLKKFSASGFTGLRRGGEPLLLLDKPATVEIRRTDKGFTLIIEGDAKVTTDRLAR